MVVYVAAFVHFLWLIFIDNPIVLIEDVLEEVLVTRPHVHHEEPLVGKWIEVHLVSHGPIVEGSANLHTVMPWSSVGQCKLVADLIYGHLVER